MIHYLDGVDPEQAEVARTRYAAPDHVREPQAYDYQVAFAQRPPANNEVVAQLIQLREDAASYMDRTN